MKINDIVTWKCPMNKAEENDKMKIKGFLCEYNTVRVVVEHINENNRISIEFISNLTYDRTK